MYLTNHACAGVSLTLPPRSVRPRVAAAVTVCVALAAAGWVSPANAQPSTAPTAPTTATTATTATAKVPSPSPATVSAATKPVTAIAPDKIQACPLQPADFKAALGVEVRSGKPSELNPKSGKLLDCTYFAVAGTMAVTLSQTWIEPAQLSSTMASIDRYSGSTPEPIANDPDRGRWLLDPVRKDAVALQYLRSNVRTEIRVIGGEQKPEVLRPRLLKLRRVP